MPNPEDEITTSEAMELLGIDRSAITRKAQMGLITPTRKLPGRTGAYLFRRSDVLALKKTSAA